MSVVAVDVPTSADRASSSPRSSDEPSSSPDGLLRRPLCRITSSLVDAALLQHLIHRTETPDSEWIRLSQGDLGDRFGRPASTIGGALGRLEARSLIASRHHREGCAKSYRLACDAVLERLADNGIEMTEAALMGHGDLDYTCRGPDDEMTVPTIPLYRPICQLTSSLLEAGLLQQLDHLIQTRGDDYGTIQVDAAYLSDPFDVAPDTIRGHLAELEDDGFVSSTRPLEHEAKVYCLERERIAEAIDEHRANSPSRSRDAQALARKELFDDDDSPHGTSDTKGSTDAETSPGSQNDRRGVTRSSTGGHEIEGWGSRDGSMGGHEMDHPINKEYTKKIKSNDVTSSSSGERTCENDRRRTPMTEVSNQPLSDLVPQNQRRVSPETDPSPTELEREAVEALNLWGFEFDTIRDIIKTFRTMGLPDRHIPSYLRDRRHDFKGRSEALDSEQIEQYVTSRQDIVKKGYLPPIVFKTPQPQAPYPDPPASSNSGDDTSSSSNSERDLSLPDSLRDPCDHESCERDVCATDACEYGPGDPVSDEPNSNEGKIPHADDIDAPYPDEEPDDDDADRTSPADSSSPEKTPCDTSDDPNENEEADETKDKTEDSDTRWSDEPCEKARALIKACRERIDDDSIENLRNPHLEDGTLHLAISPPIKGVKLTLHNESQLLQAARIVWPNETIEAVEFEPMTGREDYRT